MKIELNDKATTKVLDASGQLHKSAAEITNSIYEHLEAIEITEIVMMRFKITEADGRIRRRVVKKISTRKWATEY